MPISITSLATETLINIFLLLPSTQAYSALALTNSSLYSIAKDRKLSRDWFNLQYPLISPAYVLTDMEKHIIDYHLSDFTRILSWSISRSTTYVHEDDFYTYITPKDPTPDRPSFTGTVALFLSFSRIHDWEQLLCDLANLPARTTRKILALYAASLTDRDLGPIQPQSGLASLFTPGQGIIRAVQRRLHQSHLVFLFPTLLTDTAAYPAGTTLPILLPIRSRGETCSCDSLDLWAGLSPTFEPIILHLAFRLVIPASPASGGEDRAILVRDELHADLFRGGQDWFPRGRLRYARRVFHGAFLKRDVDPTRGLGRGEQAVAIEVVCGFEGEGEISFRKKGMRELKYRFEACDAEVESVREFRERRAGWFRAGKGARVAEKRLRVV